MPHQHPGPLCRAPEELAPEELAPEELAVLDRARSRAAQATSPAQPHHGALDLAGTIDWNLDKFARVWVAVVGHPLGTKNLQGLGDLRRREFDGWRLKARGSAPVGGEGGAGTCPCTQPRLIGRN